jgi:hypothetical protein
MKAVMLSGTGTLLSDVNKADYLPAQKHRPWTAYSAPYVVIVMISTIY